MIFFVFTKIFLDFSVELQYQKTKTCITIENGFPDLDQFVISCFPAVSAICFVLEALR